VIQAAGAPPTAATCFHADDGCRGTTTGANETRRAPLEANERVAADEVVPSAGRDGTEGRVACLPTVFPA
jgi:hypothetical protein